MNRKTQLGAVKRVLSVREKAYLHIQESVTSGSLPAGVGVSELVLARELGSSRTPIREAMNQLAAEGLLTQNPGGGMVVAQLAREDIVELYEMREALEVYAAGKISGLTLRAQDHKRLQNLIDQVEALEDELVKSGKAALDAAQMERFIGSDLGFHAFLMSLASNSRLQKLINETRLLISIFAIHRGGHDVVTLRSIRAFHQRVLDAISNQNAEEAMLALSEHIQTSRRERLEDYDAWRRESAMRRSIPVFFNSHKIGITP